MTTTTAPAATELDAETVQQLRSERASGVTIAELRKAFPSLSTATIRKAVGEPGQTGAAKRTTPKAQPVETRRERPTKPVRARFGSKAEYDAAMATYRTALAAFESGTAKRAGSAKAKAPAAKSTPKASAPKAERKPRAVLDHPAKFKSWEDPKLAAFVLREKGKGQTIKQISASLDLPAEERYWHRVSLVFRAAADAKGIERPRLSAEAIAARRKEDAKAS